MVGHPASGKVAHCSGPLGRWHLKVPDGLNQWLMARFTQRW